MKFPGVILSNRHGTRVTIFFDTTTFHHAYDSFDDAFEAVTQMGLVNCDDPHMQWRASAMRDGAAQSLMFYSPDNLEAENLFSRGFSYEVAES